MRYAICYVSTASQDLEENGLKELMEKALQKNLQKDIKGILLYSDGNFLQVLEGEKDTVLSLYHKIERDHRHRGIIQIVGKVISSGGHDSYETRIIEKESTYEFSELLKEYMKTVKGMDSQIQKTVKNILKSFLKTRPSIR